MTTITEFVKEKLKGKKVDIIIIECDLCKDRSPTECNYFLPKDVLKALKETEKHFVNKEEYIKRMDKIWDILVEVKEDKYDIADGMLKIKTLIEKG